MVSTGASRRPGSQGAPRAGSGRGSHPLRGSPRAPVGCGGAGAPAKAARREHRAHGRAFPAHPGWLRPGLAHGRSPGDGVQVGQRRRSTVRRHEAPRAGGALSSGGGRRGAPLQGGRRPRILLRGGAAPLAPRSLRGGRLLDRLRPLERLRQPRRGQEIYVLESRCLGKGDAACHLHGRTPRGVGRGASRGAALLRAGPPRRLVRRLAPAGDGDAEGGRAEAPQAPAGARPCGGTTWRSRWGSSPGAPR